MKFEELDVQMRKYETATDTLAIPGVYLVARVDGRSFTALTKDKLRFEAPYDIRFRDYMVGTAKHLMNCGFCVSYAYTQSDEISLLFHRNEDTFERKLRKFHSVLAGEASACFSLLVGELGAFDCRLSQLPDENAVCEYFRWRAEDALRNALNSHCYWTLRKKGHTAQEATQTMKGMSVAKKHDLLFSEAGINFNDLPAWHKRGIGIYWESVEKKGFNPKTGEETASTRRALRVDMELPVRDAYTEFVHGIVQSSIPNHAMNIQKNGF